MSKTAPDLAEKVRAASSGDKEDSLGSIEDSVRRVNIECGEEDEPGVLEDTEFSTAVKTALKNSGVTLRDMLDVMNRRPKGYCWHLQK